MEVDYGKPKILCDNNTFPRQIFAKNHGQWSLLIVCIVYVYSLPCGPLIGLPPLSSMRSLLSSLSLLSFSNLNNILAYYLSYECISLNVLTFMQIGGSQFRIYYSIYVWVYSGS